MADSGAQSCLWSMNGFRAAGFSNEHLIPVNMDLVAANKSPISIEGAALLRLQGFSPKGDHITCASMVYISNQAKGFYLSREAMMDLGIVSQDFPTVGTTKTTCYGRQSTTPVGSRILNAACSELFILIGPDGSRARKYLVSAIRPFHWIQNNAIHQRYEPPYHPSETQTTLSSSNENNNNKLATTRSVGLTVT